MFRSDIVHLELIARVININSRFAMQCFGMSALLKVQSINYKSVLNTSNCTVKLVLGALGKFV